jgi:uncharacterized protein
MTLLRRLLLTFLVVLLLGYIGIIVWFRANENRLVFQPVHGPVALPSPAFGLPVLPVRFSAPDGVPLTAWQVPPPEGDQRGWWILILHGNLGDLATPGRPEHDRQLRSLGLGIFALDYRGYGASGGSPDEAGVYADAHAAYDFLRDSLGVPARRIIIYGHSLGSGVATELATGVAAAGLILEGAFTSVPDRGAEVYPFLPVHLMARNRFPSLERIGRLRMPILIIHGRDDVTIPIAHGRRLFAAAPEPRTFLEVPGGHDNAFSTDSAAYDAGIRRFLVALP